MPFWGCPSPGCPDAPHDTRTMDNLNLICRDVQQLYSPVQSAFQSAVLEASLRLNLSKRLHTYASSQGIIISRALLLWRVSRLFRDRDPAPDRYAEREAGWSKVLGLP
jgi:hypothetical protein